MSFLAPWAMALGALGALGALLLHLVARHAPAAFVLPTARFIPDRHSLVSRAAPTPRDVPLLALRMLLLLCAGAAFARPVFREQRAPLGRIVLLDRSALVADSAGAARRALALVDAKAPAMLVGFGTGVGTGWGRSGDGVAPARSSRDDESVPTASGARSLTAGLIVARRAAATLAHEADSVELVIVSPLAASELDAATWPVRALWPGRIRLERVASARDSTAAVTLEQVVPVADVLGPALVRTPVHASPTAVRLRRDLSAGAGDSAFARAGGTVVLWRPEAAPLVASAVAMGDDVVVAPLARLALLAGGRVPARWADGAPAARDAPLGAGCLRTVGIGVPTRGDLPLRPAFQRLVRGLVSPCIAPVDATPADTVALARLSGTGALASAASLSVDYRTPSSIVPWLLAIALACAVGELLLRRPSHGAPS